jgi:hypothetical protein
MVPGHCGRCPPVAYAQTKKATVETAVWIYGRGFPFSYVLRHVQPAANITPNVNMIHNVRPLTENGFEIVAGARRYRAAQMAEADTVPVRIVNLNDAEALEAQLVENLIRADVHPMEEAQGFKALLDLEERPNPSNRLRQRQGSHPSLLPRV